MRNIFKYGAYVTALIHTTYVPLSVYFVLQPSGVTNTAIVNFSICTSGLVLGSYARLCPLTFLERWFRKQYNPHWVFNGTWIVYYGILGLERIVKFIRVVRHLQD